MDQESVTTELESMNQSRNQGIEWNQSKKQMSAKNPNLTPRSRDFHYGLTSQRKHRHLNYLQAFGRNELY